ncbi:LysR family transcriptional regulator [Panacibacter sp. DH6]|uniref:LysR family transcriptional regulator n=1 Tax=Panacibacter microcysteis TaxID=2793269 RepID=A0A931GYS2_9BACT|nr:hydrogen peroxide-inducible genes activator [Panacibacter microcysteis]MBG9377487.1 LysR family transcriptional regulator [Panacibacter microcysteis]
MTLIQLEYIVALDTLKHFAKAAAHCHVTQPSLSMQVQKLEEELGVQIFVRTTPVTTTDTGQLIIQQARKVLTEAANIHELIEQEKSIVGGNLKIGVIPTLAPYLLPRFVQSFTQTYPKVKLSIYDLTTENIVRQLKNGNIDAGIMATPLGYAELKEDFLFNEEFVAYVSTTQKLFDKRFLLPTDMDINNMWLLEEGHCLRNQVINFCAIQKIASTEKHFEYSAGSIETLKRFVDTNGGITLLPELATYDISDTQKNMLRYFKSPAPVREISLVTLKTFNKRRLINILKNTILENIPEQMLQKKKVDVIAI